MAGRDEATTVQIKLRMKEPLRAMTEESARERGISMNAEIVRRLERSFERRDRVINSVAIGAELYKVLLGVGSFQRRINNAFAHDESGATPKHVRDEIVSAALELASSTDRIVGVLEALMPADKGLELSVGDDGTVTRLITRTLRDDDE